jgi:SP family general alpha glucoside:H+ symporter-like MFS transporter
VFASTFLVKISANVSILIMATATKSPETPTAVPKLPINADELREIIEIEHALTFREALSLYPKAIGWSFYFSLGVIMLGTIRKISQTLGAVSYN